MDKDKIKALLLKLVTIGQLLFGRIPWVAAALAVLEALLEMDDLDGLLDKLPKKVRTAAAKAV